MILTVLLLAGEGGMSADDQKLARVDSAMNSVMKQNCQEDADKIKKKCLELCIMKGAGADQKECSGECDEMSKKNFRECDEEKKEAKKYLGLSDKERKKMARDAEFGEN